MKNRILFINPPLSSDIKVNFPNHQFPLGFLYMADVLEKNGFIVKILDCPLYYKIKRRVDKNTIKFGLLPDQIQKEVLEFKPDIVGVSCSFSMYEEDSFEVLHLVKKINKKIITVVGGAHTSSNPEYVLRNKNIDIAVIGEGELTMLEIAKKVKSEDSLTKIKGTALKADGKIRINEPRHYINNLDDYSLAWHLVDFQKYFEHPDNYSVPIRSPSVNIITSRGCPGNCVFCSVHTVWGHAWRTVSAEKVVNQIEFLVKEKGVKHIRINDDNLTLNKKRIIEICNSIIQRKIDIKWDTPSGVALWTLDEEILSSMKKSGYYRITFGIESGSEKTLRYIGKNISLEKVKKLIDYCQKLHLWSASFFIIGLPYEEIEDIRKTENFILTSKLDFPFVFIAQPYPGTRMYEDFKKNGFLKHGLVEKSNSTITKYSTNRFSAKKLNEFRRNIYKKFYIYKLINYSNPIIFYKEFLSKIRSFEDIKYSFKIGRSLISNFLY